MNKFPKEIIVFLELNGFEYIGDSMYGNEMCDIKMEDGYYAVADSDGCVRYSDDLNIYWLIGVLTYNGFMNKNYNTLRNE